MSEDNKKTGRGGPFKPSGNTSGDDKTTGRGGPFKPSGNTSGKTMMITPIKVPTLPASSQAEPFRDLRGVVLAGRLTLETKVNAGNMGEIWRASNKNLPREAESNRVLVKVLPAVFAGAKEYTEALLREADITSSLPGGGDYFPAIVDAGITDGIAFVVMSALPGEALSLYLQDKYPTGMHAKEAVPILLSILEGLAVAHKAGVFHSDVKPDNLFIEHEEGKPPKVRILDFGLAKAQSEVFATFSQTLPNGTQQYRPPEGHKAIPGDATAGGDIFAVGLCAYQMILGRHPLARGNYVARYDRGEELGALHEDKAGTRTGVDAALGAVLCKAVAFDPDERYQDAAEMLEALQATTIFTPEAIPVGAIIDRSYRVLGPLGAGGMGAVYIVKDTHRNKDEELLLKVLVCPPEAPPELQDSFRERFRRECESLYTVNHDAVPRIFANGSHEGVPYLVMEKAKGHALSRCFDVLLAKGGWDAVFHMTKGIASALDAIHAADLIHRDIKPPNIVVETDTGNAMVIDFGIVLVDDTALTADNTFIGTPGYAAPEQMEGDTVKESDQWSLGATLYYLLSAVHPGDLPGEEPEQNSKNPSIARLMDGNYPSLAEIQLRFPVPESIVNAVVKAMSQDPSDRFGSVAEFAHAMEVGVMDSKTPFAPQTALRPSALFAGGTTEPKPPLVSPLVAQVMAPEGLTGSTVATTDVVMRPAKRGAYALLAIVALVAVGGGTYALTRGDSAPASANEAPLPAEATNASLTQPLAAVILSDAPVPAQPPDATVAVEATTANVTVVAAINGKLVTGLALLIGDVVLASSDSLTLPLGKVVVRVGSGKYKGDYTCAVTSDSNTCLIELRAKKTRKGSRRQPKIDDGEEDMINFREDKPKP